MKTARIVLLSVAGTLLLVLLVLRWAVDQERLQPLPAAVLQTGARLPPAEPTWPASTTPSTPNPGPNVQYPQAPTLKSPQIVEVAANPPGQTTRQAPEQPPYQPPPITLPAKNAQASPPGEDIASAEGSVITGVVEFEGTPPPVKIITQVGAPRCAELHADNPLVNQEVIVNPNGTLANVFVYILDGLKKHYYEIPDTPVVLDQVNCQFNPHVLGIMAGQPLVIRNDDPLLHNIHVLPVNNTEFNIGQPDLGMQSTRKFRNPEVMIPVKCDVHPWMNAYIGVLSHPFYSVTDNAGVFTISGLPPGTYTVATWHEKYGPQSQTVTVADHEIKSILFAY